ncbi:MAG TPA: UDP-glucose/GDP-mannose dehydrogenase family protein [Actinomycetota bacterium]|nr:UDP-glucose/GDP-mannose dehydrogenase family protein [Actinomycetota bacterium]
MRIAIVGTGRVGLVTGVSLASLGHDVIGVDANLETVELLTQGRCSFYEPGLQEMLEEQMGAERIRFTGSVRDALPGARVVFICVGRPAGANGDLSMTAVEAVARDVALHASNGVVVVVKSTVPPGTCERIERTIRLERPGLQFHVVSSPEFLREGFAVQDTLHPDRIVVGASEDRVFKVVRDVYRAMLSAGCMLIETDRRTAELAKLASNSFLATKVSFANAIGQLCELTNADVHGVAEIMGADPRIGSAFLRAGIGYGGYCLPKDVTSLHRLAARHGYRFDLLTEVARVNDDAVSRVAAKVEDALWNLEGKRVALLGLAFKAGTDDIRSAPALALARLLIDGGAEVVGCDPMAAGVAKDAVTEMRTFTDPYEAADGAHCVVICTEWEEFRDLDWTRVRRAMAYPVLVDGRNLLHPGSMREAGFLYIGVGRAGRQPGPAGEGPPADLYPEAARG